MNASPFNLAQPTCAPAPGSAHAQQTISPLSRPLSSSVQENTRRRLLSLQAASEAIVQNASCVGDDGDLCIMECTGLGFPMNTPLRIASDTGWKELRYTVFPLYSEYGREVLVCVHFVVFASLLAFSIINTTLVQERGVVDLFNVALSAIAVLVAIINLVTVTCMQRCALIQRLVCCRKHSDSAAQRCSARCPGCNSLFMNLDLSPILLSEIFIFPVFICAMFQFLLALKKSNNQFDLAVIRGTVIFILTSLFTLFVYFLRTLNFALAFRAIQKVRGRRYNGEAGCCQSCPWVEVRFLIHMLFQIISQVVMTIIVGKAFYYENVNSTSTVVSPPLIYMTVASFVLPLLGTFSFIISNIYSLRQYPIAFTLDILRSVADDETERTTAIVQAKGVVDAQLQKTKRSCCAKYCYVMVHPALVIITLAFFALLVAFVACTLNEPYVYSSVLPSTANSTLSTLDNDASFWPWYVYDITGAIAVVVANAGVVLVAAIWILILLVGIVVTIVVGVALQCFSSSRQASSTESTADDS